MDKRCVKKQATEQLRCDMKIKNNLLQVLDYLQRRKAEGVPQSLPTIAGCLPSRNILSEILSLPCFGDNTLLVFSPNSLGALQASIIINNEQIIIHNYS